MGTMQGFDNATFWEDRYQTNIALGSGAGSRGAFLRLKRRLLTELLERFQPAFILDVGCGDIEVARTLSFDGAYTGIDLSPFVIERNRTIRPDWRFIQGDFLALERSQDVRADLVLCLDVLIHQHDKETYRAFVRALLAASRSVLVVNGFETLPKSGKLSPNVAFHEPLSDTLRASGVTSMEALAGMRRTGIFLVETTGEPILK